MNDILELIFPVICIPFKSKYEAFLSKIDRMPNKVLKWFVHLLLSLIYAAIIVGLSIWLESLLKG